MSNSVCGYDFECHVEFLILKIKINKIGIAVSDDWDAMEHRYCYLTPEPQLLYSEYLERKKYNKIKNPNSSSDHAGADIAQHPLAELESFLLGSFTMVPDAGSGILVLEFYLSFVELVYIR